MKTYRLDITHRAQFPAENEWAADRIRRNIEEAATVAAGRAVSEIQITVQRRHLEEFHGGYGRFMPIPLRCGGDGARPTIYQVGRTLRSHAADALLFLGGTLFLYYGVHESSFVGFAAGMVIWSTWLVTQVAGAVMTRFPRDS